MARLIAITLLAIFATTAGAGEDDKISYKELLARNNSGISQLALGMTKDQVVTLMKSYASEVRDGALSNPYKTESFQQGSDTYEVLYYLTRAHPPFTPIRDSQATPVVLKNGKVTGWGQSALHGVRQ